MAWSRGTAWEELVCLVSANGVMCCLRERKEGIWLYMLGAYWGERRGVEWGYICSSFSLILGVEIVVVVVVVVVVV